MWHRYHFWNSFGTFMFWVVFAVLIVMIIYIIKQKGNNKENKYEHALSILKERLARGQIDEAEYRRLKDILHEN